MQNPVAKHLHGTKLSDIAFVGDLVTLKSSSSVEEAITVLAEKKILSVPVMDSKSKECLGLIDMIDIAYFISKVAPDSTSLDANMIRSLEIAGRAIALESIGEVLNASNRDPFVPIYQDNNASMAVDIFAKGIHRVPLCDNNGDLIGTVSQTDFIKYLKDKICEGDMKTLGNKTISELGLTPKPITSVNLHDSVLAAINLINEKGYSGIGVINDKGVLSGNFSASDCVGIYREELPSFLLSVAEFLEKHSPNSMKPICCKSDITFQGVLKEMVKSNVHHIYVIDGDHKPISIVSATDIMKCIRDYTE